MKAWIIGIVAVVVIGGGGYLALHKDSGKSAGTGKNNNSSQAVNNAGNSTSQNNSDQQATATITYSSTGFSPGTVTVKQGNTVAIKNTSSSDLQFDSDPHPTHTDDEELNVGIVSPGQAVTFKVTKAGSHGYHNHFNPSDTGTLVVQ